MGQCFSELDQRGLPGKIWRRQSTSGGFLRQLATRRAEAKARSDPTAIRKTIRVRRQMHVTLLEGQPMNEGPRQGLGFPRTLRSRLREKQAVANHSWRKMRLALVWDSQISDEWWWRILTPFADLASASTFNAPTRRFPSRTPCAAPLSPARPFFCPHSSFSFHFQSFLWLHSLRHPLPSPLLPPLALLAHSLETTCYRGKCRSQIGSELALPHSIDLLVWSCGLSSKLDSKPSRAMLPRIFASSAARPLCRR